MIRNNWLKTLGVKTGKMYDYFLNLQIHLCKTLTDIPLIKFCSTSGICMSFVKRVLKGLDAFMVF